MITGEHLHDIAVWAVELTEEEIDRARRGIVEKTFSAGAYVIHRGDKVDAWNGVVDGIVKMSTVTVSGKAVSYTGLAPGGWFGEGSLIKGEPRQYDIVALRDSRIATMNGATFRWLFENSAGFNRFLVRQLNERLGQFIAFLSHDRMLGATARVARCVAWLCNPVLSPKVGDRLEISQEELGLLSGVSRQVANKCLKQLEAEHLLALEHDAVRILDITGLRHYDE